MTKKSRGSRKSRSSKNLEALKRAQKIEDILNMGVVQSQALSDSAGERAPADESHVVSLLEKQGISSGAVTRTEIRRKRRTKTPRSAAKKRKKLSRKRRR